MARLIPVLSLCVLLAGCTAKQHRQSADKAVGTLIGQRTPLVPNMDPQFTIEARPPVMLTDLKTNDRVEAFLGVEGPKEKGAGILTLERALDLAVHYSRTYQNNKEQLFLSALRLTGVRHDFAPIFSAGGSAGLAGFPLRTTNGVIDRVETVGQAKVGVDWLIRDVGRLSAQLIADFSRILVNGPGQLASSRIAASFTRPLLRNAGYKTEIEALTQAERNLLYEMRDFVKYRKDFSVQIATAYYGVLGNRDTVRNSFLNLESSRRAAERTRALAEEGRATQTDLGRLEQQVLSAESSWIAAIRSYQRTLDEFKIALGLPVQLKLILDDQELERLTIRHPRVDIDDSIRVALEARLDYLNLRDQQDDSVRDVMLAVNRFLPQLDLVAQGNLYSRETTKGFALPDRNLYTYSAGLNVDLPIDRVTERNSYREKLIVQERNARTLVEKRDQIELEVRESYRGLDQAKRTYEISEIGVRLAERRVEEQTLLAELGRAKAQDQVDAQNDLSNSKNQRTQALVGHTIARLRFYRDTGILFIKGNGQWEEVADVNKTAPQPN